MQVTIVLSNYHEICNFMFASKRKYLRVYCAERDFRKEFAVDTFRDQREEVILLLLLIKKKKNKKGDQKYAGKSIIKTTPCMMISIRWTI